MKNKKMIASMFAFLLTMAVCLTASNSFAQTQAKSATMKDCCMMKDGKMMCCKNGKTMPLVHDMTMKNGTKCLATGECIMKDGKKMQMKDGQCMDMNGKMDNCEMMNKNMKSSTEKKGENKNMAMTYTCPMHPEVTSDKPGKCPKCGMDLVKKK